MPIDYKKLVEGIRSARRVLQPDREYRVKAIERLEGKNSPVNLTELYARIVTRSMVAKEPRVHISTFTDAIRSGVHTMKLWYNEEIKRQYISDTLARCTYDSLLKIGIAKVSLASPADVAYRGYEIQVAEPMVSHVSFDDFVYDVRATDLRAATFVGHRFRLPLEVAKKMFARADLTAARDGFYNAEGDPRSTALDLLPYYQDFEEWCELWEIYLPRYGQVVTLADEQMGGVQLGRNDKPLRVQKWIGPPCGPYHYQMHNPIPDKALPNGTMRSLLLLDEAINEIYRKLIRQAKRQKKNTLVQNQAEKDMAIYKKLDDGDLGPVDDPRNFVEITRGGPDKVNEAFVMGMRQLHSLVAGNLETMGGLVPQSKTLGQEKILDQNSSATLSQMQETAQGFAKSVCGAQCWYYWYHPTKQMNTMYSLPGMPEMSVPLSLEPKDRHNYPFEHLQTEIAPYSMGYKSPQQVLAALTQALTQVFIPLQQQMAQAGVQLNLKKFASMFGEYNDIPEFNEIIETAAPNAMGASPEGPGQPPQDTTRTTRSEATGPGQESSIRQALLNQDAGGQHQGGGDAQAAN